MIKDAVVEGSAGEARLVAMLGSLRGFDKVMVVAALGDAQGERSVAALRSLLAVRQRSVDLRCAALLALAKRQGVGASDMLAAHLTGVPAAVADYAVIGLAAVGDDRAWPQVLDRLRRQLDRPVPTGQPDRLMPGVKAFEAMVTVSYLVRHLDNPLGERKPLLITALRSRFDRLYQVEQNWLIEHWPGVAPDGPDIAQVQAPDTQPFRALIHATRLLGPAY
ncbi:hypothetical protein [Virgisporangium aurantiacum]|uniref:HEAT repeat domain-containing protein n=1 Tax=Virgisporangium aurantiacum TaxID=175570 RepID=A0A8J3ZG86_9ACTN|nr:hypothetical protein [Virgisporangium aurantiacum]GIJ62332.1 hypothetical protein Vau01_098480 [Virgisporangium aurantiacum]